jgi:hypothetical protein
MPLLAVSHSTVLPSSEDRPFPLDITWHIAEEPDSTIPASPFLKVGELFGAHI